MAQSDQEEVLQFDPRLGIGPDHLLGNLLLDVRRTFLCIRSLGVTDPIVVIPDWVLVGSKSQTRYSIRCRSHGSCFQTAIRRLYVYNWTTSHLCFRKEESLGDRQEIGIGRTDEL